MGTRSTHNCWAEKSKGCTKKKDTCTQHYWTCTGEGTRTHKSQSIKNGSRCESDCTDTSDNKLYTCNIKSTCHPLNSSAIQVVLIYIFLVEWCCDNTNPYAAPLRQILFRSQSYISYSHLTFITSLSFNFQHKFFPPLVFLYPPSYFTILKFYLKCLRPGCTVSRSCRIHKATFICT